MLIRDDIDSLGKFLHVVSEIRNAWQVKSHKELWFRGEGMDYGETILRPALYRRHDANALKSPVDLLDIEDDLFAYFRHNSTELARLESACDTADPWDDYFLMQHHGGPTRLLDWSDGALIALHFALREDRKSDRKIYVLDPFWLVDFIDGDSVDHRDAREAWKEFCQKHPSAQLDEDDWDDCYLPDQDGHSELPVPSVPLVLEFDHFARRVSAQRSRFVVFGSAPDFFNRLFDHTDARIAVLTVNASFVEQMRIELRDAGITESVIFPDLDGLGREVRQLWVERLKERA